MCINLNLSLVPIRVFLNIQPVYQIYEFIDQNHNELFCIVGRTLKVAMVGVAVSLIVRSPVVCFDKYFHTLYLSLEQSTDVLGFALSQIGVC